MNYQDEYKRSIRTPEAFWNDKAKQLDWFTLPKSILSTDEHGIYHWFADGEMNTCHMALDYHIEQGRGNQIALIYDSPVTDQRHQYSYLELRDEVARTAGMLQNLNIEKGDRVIIYMPMIPEAAIAMLACARLGAVHSVVFGGFASPELAVRIDDAKPKVIMSASCGVEISRIIEYKPLLDNAVTIAKHKPQHCVIFQRPQRECKLNQTQDIDWKQALKTAPIAHCTSVKGTDPLYILYTSGTTGKPKGVVRENGGHAVAMKYSMSAIYDIKPGDVFWAASDVGWVVGHSYIVYAPLLHGATTVMYEGKPIMTPDAGAFWRVIEQYQVKSLFTAPTAYRAIKKEDPEGKLMKKYDLGCLQTVFSAGERLDPATHQWLEETLDVPVVDNWWQTETGWAIASNQRGIESMPIKQGSATVPSAGYEVRILDENGHQLPQGEQGDIAIKLPLPPSCLTTIWGNVERFKNEYLSTHPGYYLSGDGGYFDADGYLFVMGRVDDVINIAGHRLSTGEMEEVIGKHPHIAECAVIGRNDELKGQIPVGLVVLKTDVNLPLEEIQHQLVQLVRTEIGAVAALKEIHVVPGLPKTRSGKILRKTIRQIFNGENFLIPSTIENPDRLEDITSIINSR
ncbi:MAG: propionyl-CoA synthetase [Arenicella sp.]